MVHNCPYLIQLTSPSITETAQLYSYFVFEPASIRSLHEAWIFLGGRSDIGVATVLVSIVESLAWTSGIHENENCGAVNLSGGGQVVNSVRFRSRILVLD